MNNLSLFISYQVSLYHSKVVTMVAYKILDFIMADLYMHITLLAWVHHSSPTLEPIFPETDPLF